MKDKKIRILCAIVAVLSVVAVIPIMFKFFEYSSTSIHGEQFAYYVWGFAVYSDTENWWYILLGVMGIVALLWNLVYGAYAIIDGRYTNLIWRVARYGYFYGIIVGIINFSAILSYGDLAPAAWAFVGVVALVAVLETVLIFFKDEDTLNREKPNNY